MSMRRDGCEMSFDTALLNGTVVDGTGEARYRADVGVVDGRIAAIGALAEADATRRVDVSGHVVAPGFVDIHTHSDITLLDNPLAESKVHQGVTTEVVGNCGFSPFPAGPAGVGRLQEALASYLPSETRWDWNTLDGWAERLGSQGMSVNVAALVGHSALRIAAGVADDRTPKDDELRLMCTLAAQAVEQGAFGLSTGLTLPPSSYASTEEVITLTEAIASYDDAFYATHVRAWAGQHIKAREEAVQVAREAGLPVQISHMNISDSRVHGEASEVMRVIEGARRDGLDITCDVYPYTAGASTLSQLLPSWVQAGGVPAMLERLRDPGLRKRVREETARGWLDGLPWEWDCLVISEVRSDQNRDEVGFSVAEIADRRDMEPAQVLLTLIDEEDNHVRGVMHNRTEEDVRFFLRHSSTMIGSDGRAISPEGPHSRSKPHPRYYGTYPRILGRYVREVSLLTLEEAISKMTSFPARRLGLRDRGRVAEGCFADLVVFDPETVIDRATFEAPHQFPIGVSHVLVNGEAVIAYGEHTGVRPGLVLRRRSRP